MEENIDEEANEPTVVIPQNNPTPFKPPISNNTGNNKLIYELYLRKEYAKCVALMGKSQGNEFHLYLSGLINRQQLNLERALQLFKQCHMMDKRNFEYLKEIAKTMYLLGKFKSSQEAANQAAKIRKDWQTYFLFGKIASALGDPEGAILSYQRSIEQEQNEQSYIELAKEYITGKKYDKAFALLKDAVKFSEENSIIFQMLGSLAIITNKVADASLNFEIALENDPFNFNSLLGAGFLLQQRQEIDQAIIKYKYALTVSPNSAFLWNNIGMSFFEKKKNIAAYTCLKKSLYLDPFQWKGYINLGLVCLQLEKYMSAFVNFSMAISQNPKQAITFMYLGVSLSNLKDYVNAQKAYIQSINMLKDGNTYINYALLMIKKKDFVRAKDILNEAYQLDTSTPNLNRQTIGKLIALASLQQQNS